VPIARAESAPRAARSVLTGAAKAVDVAVGHPRASLLTLAAGQIAATVAFALSVTHNGWLYYQGGDQIWYGTTGWSLGQLRLPNALVGYGWSLALAPLTWITGPTFIQALPLIAVVNVLVMGPAALLCVYAIAERVGGRLLGLWSALLWVVAPYAAIPLFVSRYHEKFVDQFLPQALGLTAMADYFSMVVLLGAALFVLRSIDSRSWTDAAVAGALVGIAGGAKPPNFLFLAGAVLAYAGCRRPREALVFGAAIVPAVVTLLIWKSRGLGTLPLFSLGETHEALGAGSRFVAVQADLGRYHVFDWNAWKQNMSNLREFFYSARLAQWAPVAGAIIVFRRRAGVGALLVGWLAAFLVVKGASPLASIEGNSFFRLLMPAWPPYLLLLAAVPLLIPTLADHLGERVMPGRPGPAIGWKPAAAVVLVLCLVPLLTIALARPARSPEDVVLSDDGGNTLLTPVDSSIDVSAVRQGSAVVLRWSTGAWRAGVSYRVMRTKDAGPDSTCTTAGVTSCLLTMGTIGVTRERRFVDTAAPPGATYRIGATADYRNPPTGGDMFAVSPPVRATP
jgi:hypothetical protein